MSTNPAALAHLLLWIIERHDARPDFRNDAPWYHEGLAVELVEALRDISTELDMLFLILPHRHLVGIVEQDIGSLQHDCTCAEAEADFADARGYGDLKARVAAAVVEAVRPIRDRYEQLIADPAELQRLLAEGAGRARAVAETKIEAVKQRIGLVSSA